MFRWIRSLISAAAVVELHSRQVRVRDISHGRTFEFEPLLSIDGDQRVVAIGRPIPASAVKSLAPLANQKALSENRRIAQLILQFAFSKQGALGWIKPAPRIVLSVDNDPLNGARHLSDQALIELSTAAGARVTIVHRGGKLSDAEALRMLDGS